MKDIILQKFFEVDRWAAAIEKGVIKDIRKDQLIKLTDEKCRAVMYCLIRDGKYQITPPHTAKIPKDNGEYRTVYINEPADRVLLAIANDLLFELMPEMIHKTCKSYQTGIGCGKVVKEVSSIIVNANNSEILGWKADLSKYFDSVPINYIDKAFDKVEAKHGKSALIDVLRKYYHNDYYFDEHNQLCSKYQSLKQGCAVASWLANVLLYDIDQKLAGLDGYYVRYSDDMLFIGEDYKLAMSVLQHELGVMQMKLNPQKVEYLRSDCWFKFLGFSIKGKDISLSSTRIKTFQKEIEARTFKKQQSVKKAVNSVNRYLYKGDGKHAWATQVLSVCNVPGDIAELNKFVMDCIRSVATGKHKLGGLGYVKNNPDGCIMRGKGRHVKTNRLKIPQIEGYLTLGCMRNALITNRSVFDTLIRSL